MLIITAKRSFCKDTFLQNNFDDIQIHLLRVIERFACTAGGGTDIADCGGSSANYHAVSLLNVSDIGIIRFDMLLKREDDLIRQLGVILFEAV